MKNVIRAIFLCLSFFLIFMKPVFADNSANGYWKTIDDISGKARSVMHIWEANNRLYGRIVKVWPDPGRSVNDVCEACVDYRHNKRIVGMIIMENLKRDEGNPHHWGDGRILDPHTGKVYHFSLDVIDSGQKLRVRGYIGVPLFGRTQTWLRVPDKTVD